MAAKRLTALRLPEKLLAEIDGFVGPGKRSEFIVRAVERALLQLKQEKALKAYQGTWSEVDYPEFATPDDTEKWVRQVREGGEDRMRRHDGGRRDEK
ncbi:MAG: ribbon-helix-helix domain-containing protein [Bacillota bacterium]